MKDYLKKKNEVKILENSKFTAAILALTCKYLGNEFHQFFHFILG